MIKIRGRCSMAKTAQMRAYERSFFAQVIEQFGIIKQPLISGKFTYSAKVFFDSARPDLDGHFKAVLDCLQKAKIIQNDRSCVEITEVFKLKDKDKPRVEITLKETNQ